jgi:hypothetical protein
MCNASAIVVAGVLKAVLSGCAAEERACETMGYGYGTTRHVECVGRLSRSTSLVMVPPAAPLPTSRHGSGGAAGAGSAAAAHLLLPVVPQARVDSLDTVRINRLPLMLDPVRPSRVEYFKTS